MFFLVPPGGREEGQEEEEEGGGACSCRCPRTHPRPGAGAGGTRPHTHGHSRLLQTRLQEVLLQAGQEDGFQRLRYVHPAAGGRVQGGLPDDGQRQGWHHRQGRPSPGTVNIVLHVVEDATEIAAEDAVEIAAEGTLFDCRHFCRDCGKQ